MDTTEKYESLPLARPHHVHILSRRTVLLGAGFALLIAIGLTVGLGLGLSHGHDHESSSSNDGSASVSATATTTPYTSVSPSNGSIWQPTVNSTWQIILDNPLALPATASSISPDVEIFDIDMFTNNASTISTLHKLGKKVICYFSAGSYEPDRPDSSQFQAADKGKELDGWPGEYWLNLNSSNVRKIMAARIALAAEKGCDAIDPDNVDGYVRRISISPKRRDPSALTVLQANDNGLGLTEQDSISFLQALSIGAQGHHLAMGLKNADAIISNVMNIVSFSVNEQCVQYSECEMFSPFIAAGKPVFHIEYPKGAPNVASDLVTKTCSSSGAAAGSARFSTVMKKMSLDGWVEFCDGTVANTPTSD